ncbi:hypothetical protein [Azospirillum doebereinerae]|uniref:Uncharacterized protein n=1 Tax=Azospirillum doebereinerae TaxID=92933 RepID=A0A433J1Y9_9PROT|nr:hypothetical protein [Azospirillum doebereinerae]RUQ65110.1 hypothetical protein EJ913_25525 [Azospirillum doebereinerae]
MASDTKNVKLGVCSVLFDGVDLGYTKGGVEVAVSTETHKVTVDQFGNTEINEYVMGRTVKVTCPLAETTLGNLVKVMPGATLITDGADATKKKVEVTNGVGRDLLSVAKTLVLHPVALPASDKSEDFTVPLAATAGAMTFAYKLDEERVFKVEFTGYPDPVSKVLFVVGDETATV